MISAGAPIAETYGIFSLDERVVDSDDVNVIMLNSISEDDTSDTSETVDTNFSRSHSENDVRRCLKKGLSTCFLGQIAWKVKDSFGCVRCSYRWKRDDGGIELEMRKTQEHLLV